MSSHDNSESTSASAKGGAKRPRGLSLFGEATAKPRTPATSRFWRSLEEKAARESRDPQVTFDLARAAEQEFPAGASELNGVSRRGFMGLLGTSLAVTGVACYRPNQKIVPYVRRPPEVTPGNPLHFASAYSLEGYGMGLIVESHGGRPTKVEGNPDHPDSLGATGLYEQALPLGLYDNDRAKSLRHEGRGIAWRQFLTLIADLEARHKADGGAKLRFLIEPHGSPLLADQRARIMQKFPSAKFVTFSSVAGDGAVEGAKLAFGRPLEARHDLSAAKVIVALDADFLHDGPEANRLSRQFGATREPGPEMNRLYVAEPCPTPTGTLADHRLRVRGRDILALTQALAAELAKDPSGSALAPLAQAGMGSGDARFIAALAKDLLANRGRSVVIAGRRQPAAVHALVAAINAALGNIGKTVAFWSAKTPDALVGAPAMRALVEEIAAGVVETLVITAENPVYGAPADFKLDRLLERVPNVIYLGLHEDETAAVAKTFVHKTHVLEAWGDAQSLDGTVSLVQPLISPLWMARTESEVLAAFLGEGDKGGHVLLKEFWQRRAVTEGRATALAFDSTWEAWLGKGVIEKTGGQPENVTAIDGAALVGKLALAIGNLPKGAGLEVAFTVDPKVFDGRFANNAWLQELPHPLTKMTWDNAVLVSRATAAELGIETRDVVEIAIGDRKIEGAVCVQPGHADGSVTLSLGYGRSVGTIAKGVGFNAGVLRTSAAPWFEGGANISKTGKRHVFGITQVHWSMEGRDPVISTTLANVLDKHSEFHHQVEHEREALPTLHEPVDYSKQAYKWAMAIDLNKCSGCGVCVVACQSENNIPVVGRENVRIGREMQWIRLDLYYADRKDASGAVDADNPEMLTQPVACVHCETAPCEYVCPVNATAHSDEGLNEMIYNRCIGTRYCSNNCPYKARRFNFMDYRPEVSPVDKMINNPDVTVRSRGIMEKCTYCVQRIERARIDSRVEGRMIADGEIQTACQQSCPTGAIEFGSLNDANSKISKAHHDERRYDLLHELSTRPRTVYLARVRNPNPELG
jgi:Fe-S-cluster-containing dehydrogenase component/anaerobic selenocysteine-containing dehydrogenase